MLYYLEPNNMLYLGYPIYADWNFSGLVWQFSLFVLLP